jgi:hypothetical protein
MVSQDIDRLGDAMPVKSIRNCNAIALSEQSAIAKAVIVS